MASAPSTPVASDTVVPKSYAKGIAMTPDPLEACAALDYGSDRSFAWAVSQEVVHTPVAGHAKLEQRLLATLALPSCTDAGRVFLCQLLGLIGSAKSVPTLATLLRDVRSTDAARYALEVIPGPEADAALRAALSTLNGDAKAGLIGSIAARRDPVARASLQTISANPAEPASVRDAAQRALDSLPSA